MSANDDVQAQPSETAPKAVAKKPRHRSPAYPGIGLEEAVKRVGMVFEKENKHPASPDVVAEDWGCANATSGNAMVVIAALKYFGLLHDEGSGPSRKLRVTDLAETILVWPGGSPERTNALKKAVLMPKIYRELWARFGVAFPSDANLKAILQTEYKFNPAYISSFIKTLHASIKFANLDQASIVLPEPPEMDHDEEQADQSEPSPLAIAPIPQPPQRENGTSLRSVVIHTLRLDARGTDVTLSIPVPLSEPEYDYLVKFIDISKAMWVAEPKMPGGKVGDPL